MLNKLTKRPTTPDCRAVVGAIARRDQLRLLVDGMTAANDLGLTDAVPARLTIHTDARRRAIQLDKLTIVVSIIVKRAAHVKDRSRTHSVTC